LSSFASSSSTRSIATRTFQYGNDSNVNDDGDEKRKSSFSLSDLKPRQSAELEDELFSRLNNSGNDDDHRLLDPILKQSISRGGLDWIRSISVPSSSSFATFGGDDGDGRDNSGDEESIVVTIQPPTMLHPKLEEIASNVAGLVREEAASLIRNDPRRRSEWFPAADSNGIDAADISVVIKISPRPTTPSSPSMDLFANRGQEEKAPALRNISHFLAVYSCKGGVGKSTIAANLAYALSSSLEGARVGLVDLDVYGPSLPLLVRPDDAAVRQSPPSASGGGEGMVEPIEHGGVKLMSLGYVSPSSGVPGSGPDNDAAAVLRGPMASRVASQLLTKTNWGDLDVLVLDLPPGTGDVQLEVCQSVQLSGAVAVSTPSSLARADARKGVRMFGELGVRTLALVENMAYFVCEGGGRHYPFGKGAMSLEGSTEEGGKDNEDSSSTLSSIVSHFLPDPSHVFQLPISPRVNDANESGAPLCYDMGDSDNSPGGVDEERKTFSELADAVSSDLLLLRHGLSPLSTRTRNGDDVVGSEDNTNATSTITTVTVEGAGESEFDVPFTQLSVGDDPNQFSVRLFSGEGGYQKVITGKDLRIRDPRSGEEDPLLLKEFGKGIGGGCGGGGGSTNNAGQTDPLSMVQHHTAKSQHDCSSKQPTGEEGDPSLRPARVTKKGNYGYEVEWADGAKIIYSLLAIAKAAGGKPIDR